MRSLLLLWFIGIAAAMSGAAAPNALKGQPVALTADGLTSIDKVIAPHLSIKDPGVTMLRFADIWSTTDNTFLAAGDGKTVEAHFITDDDIIYGSMVFWVANRGSKPILVNSISSINAVLVQIQKDVRNQDRRILMNCTVSLTTRQALVSGRSTGITLAGVYKSQFYRLLGKTVNAKKLSSLQGIMECPPPTFDEINNSWKHAWIEIDRLGGAERVTVSGEISPWMVKRIERDALLGEGTIPAEALDAALLAQPDRLNSKPASR